MTDRIDHGTHDIAWVGTKVSSGQEVPGAGSWEVIDHDGCPGHGALEALGGGDTAPTCPSCDAEVRWQLSHLSPSVAADHKGVGRLP